MLDSYQWDAYTDRMLVNGAHAHRPHDEEREEAKKKKKKKNDSSDTCTRPINYFFPLAVADQNTER